MRSTAFKLAALILGRCKGFLSGQVFDKERHTCYTGDDQNE